MVLNVDFVVKGKAQFANDFRRAFEKMNASFEESFEDIEQTVIRFTVSCESQKIEILEKEVPLTAYAGMAFNS